MRNRLTVAALLCSTAALILDSRCAVASATDSLALCARVLIPSLFPLFVITGMLIPGLSGIRLPFLARLLGLPNGSEGLYLLGCCGGFPVGAAGIAQAAGTGALSRSDAERMLGLCSYCGPSFLFGVLPQFLPIRWVVALFFIQLETGILLACYWPNPSRSTFEPSRDSLSLTGSVHRAINSMLSVCAWVVLAGVGAGFLRRWLFPLLPDGASILMIGLLELSNGIFAVPTVDPAHAFILYTVFICFGGISVLLQIGGLAAPVGLRMGPCICQKAVHGILGALAAAAYLHWGSHVLFVIPTSLFAKFALEIPGQMVYNHRRKEGI